MQRIATRRRIDDNSDVASATSHLPKILLLGDNRCGKTTLFLRLTNDAVASTYVPTTESTSIVDATNDLNWNYTSTKSFDSHGANGYALIDTSGNVVNSPTRDSDRSLIRYSDVADVLIVMYEHGSLRSALYARRTLDWLASYSLKRSALIVLWENVRMDERRDDDNAVASHRASYDKFACRIFTGARYTKMYSCDVRRVSLRLLRAIMSEITRRPSDRSVIPFRFSIETSIINDKRDDQGNATTTGASRQFSFRSLFRRSLRGRKKQQHRVTAV